MRRTFKACTCAGYVFQRRIRCFGFEKLGQLEVINLREPGFLKKPLCLSNLCNKLGMGLRPVWRRHPTQTL